MRGASLTTMMLGYGGMLLTVLGVVATVYLSAVSRESILRKRWLEYVAALDREVRFQLWRVDGERIAIGQLVAIFIAVVLAILTGDGLFVLFIAPIAVVPLMFMRARRVERVNKLEASLDTWLLLLANALKASPSLGEGFQSSAKLIRAPFSEELDLVLKEMKLGTPLDQAVLNMSSRVGSRVVSSSLATILVGRQTGGDLPAILEQSAATLREMARLEGVVRTKTAEGKMQVVVLAAIPFVLLGMIHSLDPHWLTPLFEDPVGRLLLVGAFIVWLIALLLARRILVVDI